MCNRLTKLSVTMWYTFFGIFDDTSLWILPKTRDPSLCDTPDDIYCFFKLIAAVVCTIFFHLQSCMWYVKFDRQSNLPLIPLWSYKNTQLPDLVFAPIKNKYLEIEHDIA